MHTPTKILFSIALWCCFAACRQTAAPPPNVLILLADDLGYTDLGCYGSTFYETPNLDALAADGFQFTNGYANCPVCSPSRAAIQTGKYPNRVNVTDWIPGRAAYNNGNVQDRWVAPLTGTELALEEITIAEYLKAEQFQTLFSGKWHLGETDNFWPEFQGYDTNIGGNSKGAPQLRKNEGCNGYFSPYCNPRLPDGPEGEYLTDRLTGETLHWIDQHQKGPFFVNLAYYLVHTPLQAKEKLKAKYEAKARQLPPIDSARLLVKNPDWAATASQSGSYMERFVQSHATYAAMMESLDQSVGQLIQALKDKGLYDNTLIIFTSDNGGLSTAEGSPTSNLPLRGGKGWLYEGGIRVPFIIKPPKNQGKGQKIDIPVAGIDLLPTILSYLETDFQPKNGPIDGRNLRPLMEGNEFEKRRPLFWHYPHYANQGGNPGAVIRQDNMKLIEDFETGAMELYDLSTDIGEQHNLADERPELRDQLYAELKAWQDAHAPLRMDVPNTKWTGKIVDGKEVVEVK